jgi:hypothetical protein
MAAELSPAQLIAAKGDTLAGTGANSLVKVAVGADGQVLTADSTQTAGVKWAPGGLGSSADASSTVKGITKLSVDPATATNPIAVGVNDPTYTGHAPLASPAFTGTPTVPTAAAADNTTKAASTAYVRGEVSTEATARSNADALLAPLASPALTGTPTVPTAAGGTNTTQAASTAYVRGEVSAEATARSNADALLAPLASPAFTGNPTVPNQTTGDNTTKAANTAFVQTASGLLIPKSLGTTKGDTIAFTGSGVPVRKAAGADGQLLQADSTQSDGLAWAYSPADQPRIAVGRYNTLSPTRLVNTVALTQNIPQAMPFVIAAATALDRIGIEVTTAAASSVLRIAVFIDAAGIPVTLTWDASQLAATTLDASTTGFKEFTIARTLPPGRYWVAVVAQGAGCSVRSSRGDLVSHSTALTASGFEIGAINGPSTTGVFGGTFGAISNGAGDGPRVLVRGV